MDVALVLPILIVFGASFFTLSAARILSSAVLCFDFPFCPFSQGRCWHTAASGGMGSPDSVEVGSWVGHWRRSLNDWVAGRYPWCTEAWLKHGRSPWDGVIICLPFDFRTELSSVVTLVSRDANKLLFSESLQVCTTVAQRAFEKVSSDSDLLGWAAPATSRAVGVEMLTISPEEGWTGSKKLFSPRMEFESGKKIA